MSENTESKKMSKKELKALEFKAKQNEKKAKELEEIKEEIKQKQADEPVKKKRKTRRGKKGKGANGPNGPRFILFVGNLPYTVGKAELMSHFRTSEPDNIRIRQDKGIAFLEFSNERDDIQKRIEVALRLHHTILNNRKINVELTAGGGGNSKVRLEKIKTKNEKLLEERRTRIIKQEKEQLDKRNTESKNNNSANKPDGETSTGIHPSRLNLITK
ncbi:unnamed protein product [[Candida] boidinii]|nr:hypothetical protein BVG19_g30 [[Candida] boidinii]OWB52270.1 hypothetical protein B5S27_g3843 [[Candida] boidinii]OWB85057.1 hypothetical protein B5S33_g3714 [[Candida] boidinii]GME91738.1 unnamed protein product [[Candida] boidinii]